MKLSKSAAIKKMQEVESLLRDLKKSGCKVYCYENDRLVLEYGKTISDNEQAHKNELSHGKIDNYSPHFSPKVKFDYEIDI